MFVCPFCQKRFKREKTLETHECEPKRRSTEQDSPKTRLAHRLFNLFRTQQNHPPVIKEDFLCNSHFLAFEKFAGYLLNIKCIDPESYLKFCLKNKYLLRVWYKEEIYQHWLKVYILMEDPESGIHRSLKTIFEFTDDIAEFFELIPENIAVSLIRDGELSPWVFLLLPESEKLLTRFTDYHNMLLTEYLNPRHWKQRSVKFEEQIKELSELLNVVGA